MSSLPSNRHVLYVQSGFVGKGYLDLKQPPTSKSFLKEGKRTMNINENPSENLLDEDLFEEASKTQNFVTLAAVFLIAAGLIGVSWYLYNSYQSQDEEVIVISSDADEIKTKPADPGGMIVNNMDKSVYDSLDNTATSNDPKAERLLPPAEEPLAKSELAAQKKIVVSSNEATKNADESKSLTPVSSEQSSQKMAQNSVNQAAHLPAIAEESTSKAEEYIKPVAKETARNKVHFTGKNDRFYKVQIASFKSRNDADKEWNNFSRRFPKLVGKHKHFIVAKNIEGKGIFHRLQVGPFKNEDAAQNACKNFKDSNINCFVIKP